MGRRCNDWTTKVVDTVIVLNFKVLRGNRVGARDTRATDVNGTIKESSFFRLTHTRKRMYRHTQTSIVGKDSIVLSPILKSVVILAEPARRLMSSEFRKFLTSPNVKRVGS